MVRIPIYEVMVYSGSYIYGISSAMKSKRVFRPDVGGQRSDL